MTESNPARGPSTLLARTNLVLSIGALLIVIISTAALYAFVIDPITEQSADDEAALLVLSAQTWVELPPEARPYFELEMAESHDFIISEARQPLQELEVYPQYLALLSDRLSDRLAQETPLLQGEELLWVDVPMGGFELQIGFSRERREVQPLYVAIVIVGMGAAIVFFTSLFIVQRIARPLVKVAEQAEHFRGANEIEPLPETGPRELVSLARNFNTMAQEIASLLNNRTTLLAGISHDLRTPLTRMRLALALLPESVDADLVARFERNLESMDELIGDALRFARGTRETVQEMQLVPIIQEILNSFESSIDFDVRVPADYTAVIAPSALRRVVMNLVGNGLRHAEGVKVRLMPGILEVVDNGPGIPEAYRETVFQPFFRLDTSRNAGTGGSGLGLAIVQQLCQAHHWHIAIDEAEGGGTRVTLQFA